MNMKKSLLFYSVLMSLLLMVTACNRGSQATPEAAAVVPTKEAVKGVPVEVAPVNSGDIALVYAYSGNLQAADDVNILPKAAGEIVSLMVDVGDVVKAGQPIALVQKDRYELQLKQAQTQLKTAELNLNKMLQGSRSEEIATAQAAVELARAMLRDVSTVSDDERTKAVTELARAEATLKKAQADYDKISWAGDVGTTPQALALQDATISYESKLAGYKLDSKPTDTQLSPLMLQLAQAELNLVKTKAPFREIDFDIARNGVAQAKVGVDLAQLTLNDTTIKAPFDGIVAERYVAQGSTVSQASPVVRFLSAKMEVQINVEESRIGNVKIGQNAALRVSAYPGQDFPAIVTKIAPIADKDTRTFVVTVAPQDEKDELKAGMFATVSLLIDEKKDTILAPLTSITTVNDQNVVYVVNGDKVELRKVEIGIANGDQVEILAGGLKANDRVVVIGQPDLQDGAVVEVVNN